MRKLAILSVVILAMFVVGCTSQGQIPKDPYAYSAYGSLATSMSARDLMYGYVEGLYKNKLVSEEGWKAFDSLDTEFLRKYLDAAKAGSKYKQGLLGTDAVEAAKKLMDEALNKLKEYYLNQIPADQRKPLF